MASRSFFSKLFSSPVAGLDIADQSIRYVILDQTETGFEISEHGMLPLPEGVIVSGNIEDPKQLIRVLQSLRNQKDLYKVRVSLPASHAFIIENAGMKPHAHELRGQALARTLLPKKHGATTMLVNIGEYQTDIAVAHEGKVYFAKSISVPNNLTQNLINSLSISRSEAEDIKRSIGLSRKPEHEHIFAALLADVSGLADELDAAFIEWHMKKDEDRPRIQEIILSGSNAHSQGLPEYLSSTLRTNVSLGNPWRNVNSLKKYVPPLHRDEALGYATALGLALGE